VIAKRKGAAARRQDRHNDAGIEVLLPAPTRHGQEAESGIRPGHLDAVQSRPRKEEKQERAGGGTASAGDKVLSAVQPGVQGHAQQARDERLVARACAMRPV
jgi:hypothetical protein